ncbi:DUF2330 domain-containing protein [Roseateles saccharophilus]|uniref:DUF2330 domain-containing protein n=1 Tax=Roseateles saccharophilus TaxID=304 RepID=A0A4R3VB15_ROSSA|nr:DUF2330 domain-containing protein [Roseateles saccharophilus]MDG0831614.1 DUF2330 domain-containing protein [Roseateles saccharophilus]TCV00973.1 hypothetical protein EV671_1007102 [Roseateles saccharophilus]
MRRFACAATLALLSLSAQAFCGFYAGKADASLFNEASQVVIARDGPRTVLTMVNDYKGALTEFALVVPTPQVIREGQVRVLDKAIVEHLDAFSAPRLAEYHDSDPCRFDFRWGEIPYPPPMPIAYAPTPAAKSARDAALGVTVEARYTLEEYDIVSLSATQSDGLETWLAENGYRIPKGASAALRPYIAQGMKFFVAKVNLQNQARTGYTMLRPLQFAFESEKFMLPMRLGMLNAPPDKPQDLIVYVLSARGRVESSSYRTARLPTGVNLPFFAKPLFKQVYQDMFSEQARREDYRVVWTEYFWNMGFCDPCAAEPLTLQEQRKLGAFWTGGGDPIQNFKALVTPGAEAGKMDAALMNQRWGGTPTMVTRLHLRYTANSFPEDLMLTQTSDQQNWQARYVIQQPYDGTLGACFANLNGKDCPALCKPKVASWLGAKGSYREKPGVDSDDPAVLQRDCESVCTAAKRAGLQAAGSYYQRELPERLQREKLALAQLTGWSLARIDALPDAQRYGAPAAMPDRPWWQRLFGTR